VILPAFNEQEALPGVLAELARVTPWADVLVVNDGSTDATSRVAHRCARARELGRVRVLDLPLNLGVGGAMRAGYVYAVRGGYDIALQLDSDGQHDPNDVPRLVAALTDSGANIVIGARFAGRGDYTVRGPRLWAMRFLSTVISRLAHTRLTDTTSGFKACDRRAMVLFSRDYPAEYLGDTIESLVIAIRSGLVIKQIGVAMRRRAGGAPSHHPIKAAIYLLRAILALIIAISRPIRRNSPEVDLLTSTGPIPVIRRTGVAAGIVPATLPCGALPSVALPSAVDGAVTEFSTTPSGIELRESATTIAHARTR